MYRKIRIVLALVFFVGITLLLAGLGGFFNGWLDFMPKLQFLPAVLALNLGTVLLVVLLTFVGGRVYCSVICPLGVFQDIISWLGGKLCIRKKRRQFHYVSERRWPRYGIFGLFVLSLLAGVQVVALLIAPYSLYGRFVHSFFQDYGWLVSCMSVGTALLVAIFAFLGGRTWCNAVCPVGTALSFLSRFSLFRPVIDVEKCRNCRQCERHCKASCIDIAHHHIDYSRCVACFDCLDSCKFDSLHYTFAYSAGQDKKKVEKTEKAASGDMDISRRGFLFASVLAGSALVEVAAQNKVKALQRDRKRPDKVEPERKRSVIPPGAVSREQFYAHCTACHLCLASCPQQIIRPGLSLDHFMQPELTYAKKACDPSCNRCAQVCPAGALRPYRLEDKKKQVCGHAVVDLEICLFCGKCSRACPYGAITMESFDTARPARRKPVVHSELCVGCGACELACPVRPVSSIHVEGVDDC